MTGSCILRHIFTIHIVTIGALLCAVSAETTSVEYEGYDGWYNNLISPDWGTVDGHLLRNLPAAYSDGVYEPAGVERPNPLTVSEAIMNGTAGLRSDRSINALLVFFGQQVVEEILDAQRAGCPPEYFNIPIPENNTLYGRTLPSYLPFLRTRYDMRTGYSPNNPRQQLNEITPFIDGGLVYGTTKAWADALRAFDEDYKGKLKAKDDKHKQSDVTGTFPMVNDIKLPIANPPPPLYHKLRETTKHYVFGNPRGNENPFLFTFGVVWFRLHNYLADKFSKEHDDWDDEKVYNEARKWLIAIYQNLVMYEWLPAWLGGSGLDKYKAYSAYIHPGISQEFQSAAMRFGHTLVPAGVLRRNKACEIVSTKTVNDGDTSGSSHPGIRTCNSYWIPYEIVDPETQTDIEEVILGMAYQFAEKEDTIIVPDLRGFVFGPLEFSRRDLMAVNIQRGRDHGLPGYNEARKYYKLSEINSFRDINPTRRDGMQVTVTGAPSTRGPLVDTTTPGSGMATTTGVPVDPSSTPVNSTGSGSTRERRSTDGDTDYEKRIAQLEELYRSVDELDIWVGGLMETTANGPGPLFRAIILDQFTRIRDGDRFWFENYKLNKLFTEDEVDVIRHNYTVRKILTLVTRLEDTELPQSVFKIASGDHCYNETENLNVTERFNELFDECTEKKTFDYFEGSEWSYALTFFFVGAAAVGCILLMICLAKLRQKQFQSKMGKNRPKSAGISADMTEAIEWVSLKDGSRNVTVTLDLENNSIIVKTPIGKELRTLDLRRIKRLFLHLSVNNGMKLLMIKVPKEYDLALQFTVVSERSMFLQKLETFLDLLNVDKQRVELPEKAIKTNAVSFRVRQERLRMFFKAVFAQAFKIEQDQEDVQQLKSDDAQMIVNLLLNRQEFADAMGIKPNSLFLNNLFPLVDKDSDGYITFREVLDLIVIFSKGTAKDKARLLFSMYDIDKSGRINRDDFTQMFKSLLEMSSTSDNQNIETLVDTMKRDAGISSRVDITFEDFNKILGDKSGVLTYAHLGWEMGERVEQTKQNSFQNRARQTFHRAYSVNRVSETTTNVSRLTMKGQTKKQAYPKSKMAQRWFQIKRYIENYRLQIFWVTLYTLVTIGIFVERAYYYSVEREHGGLRRIAGYGVTVTRGAASSMMFTYSFLLITMCRNSITFLRETFLHRFIPFDSFIAFHKYVSLLALFFTVMHCIGHAINFYHVATQTANDLTCLFRDYFHATHELPKFHDWCFTTITGLTGVIVTVQIVIMYVFATQYSRRHLFMAFWWTHSTYIIMYVLFVLHGSGRLVQDPLFQWFLLGPMIIYIFDKMVSFSRKKVEIPILKSEHLPSDVYSLYFKRPPNFEYLSGQWLRIACPQLGANEYHPFTISSAPHEDLVSLHIRAVGPWTNNLRRLYDPNNRPYPKVYVDGPFGEGHQDWYKFPVAVLVGGGIGVTPFASILKDIVFKAKIGIKFPCKKVYFLWVTRTQKQFEWLTDIISEVEQADTQGLVDIHIFITQFQQKFDLRTTMLYICETRFQKISGRSLFTGLCAITHFGRPNFVSFLDTLQDEHRGVNVIGVFSCGPPPMTGDVERACGDLNKVEGARFVHHFENF